MTTSMLVLVKTTTPKMLAIVAQIMSYNTGGLNSQNDLAPFFTQQQTVCLAKNIYFEAGLSDIETKVYVAQVTRNRVFDPRYPSDFCRVVADYKQFSWTLTYGKKVEIKCTAKDIAYLKKKNPGQKPKCTDHKIVSDMVRWRKSVEVAVWTLADFLVYPQTCATSYANTSLVNPYWGKTMKHVGFGGEHAMFESSTTCKMKPEQTAFNAGQFLGIGGGN